MDTIASFFSHPFTWGLLLGLLLAGFSSWNHWKTKRELRRYQRHLSDKMELEARQLEGLKSERERMQVENENLRLRIGMLNEKPEHKLSRDLEVLVRAEKRMMIHAPGFAAAWETAKAAAAADLEAEDRGLSLPKRLFSRLLGTSPFHEEAAARSAPSAAEGRQGESRAEEQADAGAPAANAAP